MPRTEQFAQLLRYAKQALGGLEQVLHCLGCDDELILEAKAKKLAWLCIAVGADRRAFPTLS
jgi:hypothetical protein